MANARLNTAVTLKPSRSQVFLVAFMVFAVIAILCSMYLFVQDKPAAGWAFLIVGAGAAIGSLIAWRKSQPDVDLDTAHATQFKFPDGTQIMTDSRLVRDAQTFQNFLTFVTSTLSRQPLPEPSGLLDTKNALVPDSQKDAIERIQKINAENKAMKDSFIKTFKIEDENIPLIEIPTSPKKLD